MLTGPATIQDDAEQIIKQYSDMVYRLAVSNMKSRSDADDVYQEVFLRYIKEIKKGQHLRVTSISKRGLYVLL